jgi:hypothetical protein
MTSRKFLLDTARELSRELDEEEGKQELYGGGPGIMIPTGALGMGLIAAPAQFGRPVYKTGGKVGGKLEGKNRYKMAEHYMGQNGEFYYYPSATERAARNPERTAKQKANDKVLKQASAAYKAWYRASAYYKVPGVKTDPRLKAEVRAAWEDHKAGAGAGRRRKAVRRPPMRSAYSGGYIYG